MRRATPQAQIEFETFINRRVDKGLNNISMWKAVTLGALIGLQQNLRAAALVGGRFTL
jgi:hypothetical protein